MSALRHTWLAFPSMAGGLTANARRDCTRSVPARARLGRWEKLTGGNWQPRLDLVAGLVPRASRIEDPDLARAVREREDAIAKRALDLAEHAVRSGVPWAKAFGPPPPRPAVAQAWWDRLAVVAAYRDRWRITADTEHPRRGEGCRLALPSRTPRPGAAGRAGSCSLGRPGSADGSPGARGGLRTARSRGRVVSRRATGASGSRSWPPRPRRRHGPTAAPNSAQEAKNGHVCSRAQASIMPSQSVALGAT